MNIRQTFIVSKAETLKKLLEPLQGRGKVKTSDLSEQLGNVLRGGSFGNVLRDAKTLELVANGTGQGVEITQLGEQFLKDRNHEFMQFLALKVQLFNEMFYQGIKDRQSVEHFIKTRLETHYKGGSLKVYSNLAVLRYLEFAHTPSAVVSKELARSGHIFVELFKGSMSSDLKMNNAALTVAHLKQILELQTDIQTLYKKYPKEVVREMINKTD